MFNMAFCCQIRQDVLNQNDIFFLGVGKRLFFKAIPVHFLIFGWFSIIFVLLRARYHDNSFLRVKEVSS